MKIYLLLSVFLLCLSVSCLNTTDRNEPLEYIDIYYTMGYVDSDGPCERKYHHSEVIDKGSIYINRAEYSAITRLLVNLDTSANNSSTHGMCLQSNFHFADSSYKQLCIGQFGDMTINSKSFVRNDSLTYLLRMYSGFYNYYDKKDLSRFFKEVSIFGMPENYHDMSPELDTSSAFYAKVRILME